MGASVSAAVNALLTRPGSWLRLVTSTKTVGGAGEQWAQLAAVPGIVEHDEHPTPGQLAAVLRGERIEVGSESLG